MPNVPQAAPFALAVAMALLLSGCLFEGHEDPTKLAALKKESIAAMKPPGGELVLSTEFDADPKPGLFPSKPSSASLLRVYAYEDPERAMQGGAAAREAARADGWKLRTSRLGDRLVFGSKRVPSGPISLTIGVYEDKAGVRKVSIDLEHTKCVRCEP